MKCNAKVLIRLRPLLTFEDEPAWLTTNNNTIQCLNSKSVRSKINKSKHLSTSAEDISLEQQYTYNFDKIIQDNLSSEKIYKNDLRVMVEQSMREQISSTIVAYGQTCSGKTYTLLGVKQAPGIIPCTFRDIFQIKNTSNNKATQHYSYAIKISYIEIYNQKIHDLLNPNNPNTIKIINDQQWGSEAQGIAKKSVHSFEDCLQVLDVGESNRKYGQKDHHDRSSRSHTILRIYIEKLGHQRSVISIVDLAGSERLSTHSHSQNNQIQTAHINKSLFQFSNVICRLSENSDRKQFIPYRDSKLTRLLETSLTRNSMICVIFCLSPALLNFQESVSTLRLATKARNVECDLTQSLSDDQLSPEKFKQLQEQIREKNQQLKSLQLTISQLNEKVAKLEDENKKMKPTEQLAANRKTIQLHITALIDHGSFMVSPNELLNECESLSARQSRQIEQLKSECLDDLTAVYQRYTEKLVGILRKNQDETWLKIESICFVSAVQDYGMIASSRLQAIRQMYRSMTEIEQKSDYGRIVKSYVDTLQRKCIDSNFIQYTHSRTTSRDLHTLTLSNRSHPYDTNSQNSPICEQSTIQLPSEDISGQIVYSWGCRKECRVFESENRDTCGLSCFRDSLGQLRQIVCGAHHSLVVNEAGQIFGWGKNENNQIRDNHKKKTNFIKIPKQIEVETKIIAVAAGWAHSLALSEEGYVYSWGYGQDGQLGHGNNYSLAKPTKIECESAKNVMQIYAGHSHSGFINSKANYFAFGFNRDYRLMIAETKEVNTPLKIGLYGVVMASLGVSHTCLLTKSGRVYCGGVGSHGELGVELNPSITGYETIAGARKTFQEQEPTEKVCPMIEVEYFSQKSRRAIAISCGQHMTAVISCKKELYTFGSKSYHRLGHTNREITQILSDVSRVSLGYRHGFAWDAANRDLIYGWGFNMHNQLGSLSPRDITTPQPIPSFANKSFLEVSAGFFHSAALAQ